MCSARHSDGLATGECSCRTNPDNIHTGCLWNIVVKLVSTYSSSLFPFPAMAMERILVVPLATFVLHQPATPPHGSQPNVTDLKRMLRAFHPAVHTLFYSLRRVSQLRFVRDKISQSSQANTNNFTFLHTQEKSIIFFSVMSFHLSRMCSMNMD